MSIEVSFTETSAQLEFPSADNTWHLNNGKLLHILALLNICKHHLVICFLDTDFNTAWFVKQSNFNVRLRRKHKVSFLPDERQD